MLSIERFPSNHDFYTMGNEMHHGKYRGSEAFSLKVDGTDLDCVIDEEAKPCITCMRRYHHDMYSLIQDFPQILQPQHLSEMSKIINFFLKGVEFQVIEDADTYKTSYKKELERENNCFDFCNTPLISFGEFDIDEVKNPYIEEGKLIYYVKGKIPMRASIEYPILSEHPIAHYEMLPYS